MKYAFKPQTYLLVAGMVATAYATCYTQVTSGTAVCFNSGETVDAVYWPSLAGNSAAVVATADWVKGGQTGVQDGKLHLNAYTTAGSGLSTFSSDNPSYCFGSAKFLGPGGNETVSYWENNAAVRGNVYSTPATPKNGGSWGEASGSTCP